MGVLLNKNWEELQKMVLKLEVGKTYISTSDKLWKIIYEGKNGAFLGVQDGPFNIEHWFNFDGSVDVRGGYKLIKEHHEPLTAEFETVCMYGTLDHIKLNQFNRKRVRVRVEEILE